MQQIASLELRVRLTCVPAGRESSVPRSSSGRPPGDCWVQCRPWRCSSEFLQLSPARRHFWRRTLPAWVSAPLRDVSGGGRLRRDIPLPRPLPSSGFLSPSTISAVSGLRTDGLTQQFFQPDMKPRSRYRLVNSHSTAANKTCDYNFRCNQPIHSGISSVINVFRHLPHTFHE
jgi:hypothetical protein